MATATSNADRTASEARRPGSGNPGRRRQPSGARERWKPDRGETPQAARCATRTRARPAMFLGRGRPDFKARCTSRSEEHTSELQSLMRISYAVFCLKKKIIDFQPIATYE